MPQCTRSFPQTSVFWLLRAENQARMAFVCLPELNSCPVTNSAGVPVKARKACGGFGTKRWQPVINLRDKCPARTAAGGEALGKIQCALRECLSRAWPPSLAKCCTQPCMTHCPLQLFVNDRLGASRCRSLEVGGHHRSSPVQQADGPREHHYAQSSHFTGRVLVNVQEAKAK